MMHIFIVLDSKEEKLSILVRQKPPSTALGTFTHTAEVTVWYTISCFDIIGPYFLRMTMGVWKW
jgi:hypothetical protein